MFDSGAENTVGAEADRAAERDRLEGRVVDISILGQSVRPFGTFRAGFAGWARRALCAGSAVDTGGASFPFKPSFAGFAPGAGGPGFSIDPGGPVRAGFAIGACSPGFAIRAGCPVGAWRSFRSRGADFALHAPQA